MDLNGEKKRTHARKITRCGCEAMITVKHMKDGKYSVSFFHEEHTHEFVTPRKQHLIKYNRKVTEQNRGCCLVRWRIDSQSIVQLLMAWTI